MAKPALRQMMDGVDTRRGGHSCLTCHLLESLEGDDLVALQEWLADRRVSARMIVQAVRAYGLEITQSSVMRHRREHSIQ